MDRGQTGLTANFRQKAPEIHVSLVCPRGLSPAGVCVIIHLMSTAVVKMEPKSEGIATPRKKRPKEIAVITECCTGCAGSPACVPYCPVADCM